MKQSFAVSNKSNYVNDNDDERKILVYMYTMKKGQFLWQIQWTRSNIAMNAP